MIKKSPVERNLYVNFLRRAEQCLKAAGTSLSRGDFDAAAINSVHCGISAADAMCVNFLKYRHSGEKHGDIKKLLEEINVIKKEDMAEITSAVMKIIRMKNMAEYEERNVRKKEAELLVETSEKLMKLVKEYLPE